MKISDDGENPIKKSERGFVRRVGDKMVLQLRLSFEHINRSKSTKTVLLYTQNRYVTNLCNTAIRASLRKCLQVINKSIFMCLEKTLWDLSKSSCSS